MDAKGILMHIDRTNEVVMTPEAAPAADPMSSLGLVTMPAALHLRMLPAQCARGLNRTKKGAEDSLHRLAVQGKAPFSQLMQVVLVRPPGMAHSGLSVGINADVPDLGRFAARAALRRRKALGDREVR
jgi:hypothetical protein